MKNTTDRLTEARNQLLAATSRSAKGRVKIKCEVELDVRGWGGDPTDLARAVRDILAGGIPAEVGARTMVWVDQEER